MKIRYALSGVAAAAVFGVGMSMAPGAAAASPTGIMQPANAKACNGKFCVSVSGVGTYIDEMVVTAATEKGKLDKVVYAQDDEDDMYWQSTDGGKHSVTMHIWRTFDNNSRFCGGATSTATPADRPDSICFTIHR